MQKTEKDQIGVDKALMSSEVSLYTQDEMRKRGIDKLRK